MKKKILILASLCWLMFASALAQTATAPSGSGTASDPYQITSLENLYWLSQTDSIWGDSLYFKQTANINASETSTWNSGEGVSPIGNENTKFTGNYNGQGYTIDSLTINRSSTDHIGLFGYTYCTTINNLGLTDVSIVGHYDTGSLVGYCDSTLVSNSYSTGLISGSYGIGGLIGLTDESSIINKCYSTGSVFGIGGSMGSGGLVGSNCGSLISNSYSSALVSGDGYVGGLVGMNKQEGDVTNCYSTGLVSGNTKVGGLIGMNERSSKVNNSYYNNETSGQTSWFGRDDNYQTVTTLTTAQMKQSSNFTLFDFTNTWKIDENITFPCLRNVSNVPVIIHKQALNINVNETYKDTIQFVYMDHKKVSIEVFSTPDTITLTQDSIISFIPTTWLNETITIRVTDTAGGSNTYMYNLYVGTLIGSGTQSDPYQISSLDNLLQLSARTNFWDKDFIQTADIDASETRTLNSGDGFSPIGNESTNFTGNYNGQGYTIDSLTINRPSTDYIGLFGYAKRGTIDSVRLTRINVQGKDYVGGLVGMTSFAYVSNSECIGSVSGYDNIGGLVGQSLKCDVNNSKCTGSVSGHNTIGGLVGQNIYLSTIDNSSFTGTVSGIMCNIGGLVGWNNKSSKVNNSYSNSSVSGSAEVGGLVGYNYSLSTIDNSYSIGSVSGSYAIGGLIGRMMGSNSSTSATDNCYSTCSVSGKNYVGGLVGSSLSSTINNSYSTGLVSGNNYVGGLVGKNSSSSIDNSYSTGLVSGNDVIGGLVGDNYSSSSIDNCYSTGSVSGNNEDIGGLVGRNEETSTVNNCHYNSETSGQTSGIASDDNNQSVSALTTKAMKQNGNFSSWDFTDTWDITADGTYPALKTVSNNAPFAFADTINIDGNNSVLINDYDYETAQNSLTCKLISSSTKGSIQNNAYSFNVGISAGTKDTITYCVGELLTNGDTLWGNYAEAILTKINIPTIITWESPEVGVYGTAISSEAMDATASNDEGVISYSFASDSIFDAGTYQLIATYMPNDPDDYRSATDTVEYLVNRAMLTVTAENKNMTQGDALPELTMTYVGFVNGDSESDLDVTPTISTLATASSAAGDYVITVSGGSDDNYDFTYVDGTLTISPSTAVSDLSVIAITAYPNPVTNDLTVTGSTGMASLYNLAGVKVLVHDLSQGHCINLSELCTGVYILHVDNTIIKVIKK